MHTMRSAFKRWLILHGEDWRAVGYIRVPNWFRWHIRNNYEYDYNISSKNRNYYMTNELDTNNKRRFKGNYVFDISDEALIKLKRPAYIK